MTAAGLSQADRDALVAGRHPDPFAVLGVHAADGHWLVRALVHGAADLEAIDQSGQSLGPLACIHPEGLFESRRLADRPQIAHYAASCDGRVWNLVDPYLFGPVLGPLDDYYAAEGSHLRLYDKLGAHLLVHEGVAGVHFAVWAPNARRVSVVGDFNAWDGRRHVMRRRLGTGIFEIFLPAVGAGALY